MRNNCIRVVIAFTLLVYRNINKRAWSPFEDFVPSINRRRRWILSIVRKKSISSFPAASPSESGQPQRHPCQVNRKSPYTYIYLFYCIFIDVVIRHIYIFVNGRLRYFNVIYFVLKQYAKWKCVPDFAVGTPREARVVLFFIGTRVRDTHTICGGFGFSTTRASHRGQPPRTPLWRNIFW